MAEGRGAASYRSGSARIMMSPGELREDQDATRWIENSCSGPQGAHEQSSQHPEWKGTLPSRKSKLTNA